MRNKAIVILSFVLLLMFSGMIFCDIPTKERAALIALYNSTNGDNWLDNSGWKGNNNEADGFSQFGSEGEWKGITVVDDHVTKIILRINNLEGTIPAELGNLPNLETLDLFYNRLEGNIPPDIGNIQNLTYLNLSANELNGGIPAALGSLQNLKYLDLHSNQLTGIPSELVEPGNLPSLTELYLSGNLLAESIPPGLGNLLSLIILDLHSSQLTGNIPTSFENLTSLEELYLNDNELSGGIPDALGTLSNLTKLHLQSNNLKGPIPTDLTNLTLLSETDIAYNGLYTEDTGLITFLDIKDPDWKDTQTVAPENGTAIYIDSTTFEVSWVPITYKDDPGGYLVSYRTTTYDSYVLYDKITKDKEARSMEVTGLIENTKYYFVVKTRTYPHDSNQNTVESIDSAEFTPVDPTEPTVTATDPSNITCSTAVIAGDVIDSGGAKVTERGVCWRISSEPQTSELCKKDETGGTGTFEIKITGLLANTDYHARAYATNFKGTSYSDDFGFKTLTPCLPTVETIPVLPETITCTTAICGGNVTDHGGVEDTVRGVCWSTSENFENEVCLEDEFRGEGEFTIEITGLSAGIDYYVRAYATNSEGTEYGDEVPFTTVEKGKITVTTDEVSNITCTKASCGGNVVDNCGGTVIIEKGVCWSTSPNPTTDDSTTSDGTDAGSFTSSLTGLSRGTTYYVRAYAISNGKTTYDEEDERIFPTEEEGKIIVTTAEPTDVTSKTATFGGNVADDCEVEVDERGFCWSTSPEPTLENCGENKTTAGSGTGTFTSDITGLSQNTTYHVRAYAYAISSEFPEYGENKPFTTKVEEIKLPTVTTAKVTKKTTTTATCGGEVTDEGGADVFERGICLSTSPKPTIADRKEKDVSVGKGKFEIEITVLTPGTKYYVRAYARNSVGTNYGDDKAFTTKVEITKPTVKTANVTNITTTTATCGGDVKDDGGAKVTERGVCWSTSPDPTLENCGDKKTTDGIGEGTFISEIAGLTPGTEYHVRAYAKNSAGTSFGEDKEFTTKNKFTISGRVTISIGTGITGLPGVNLEFSSGGEKAVIPTDSNGYYEHDVNYGWSGTVTPLKKRYTFSPPHQSYNVTTNKKGQDFKATANSPAISGRVLTSEGSGLSEVKLDFSNNGGTTYTNDDGYYIHPVDFGWSGTVTAEKTGYYIKPDDHDGIYKEVTSDKTDQNYTATDDSLPVISGNVTISKDTGIEGFPDVTMLFSPDSGGPPIKTNSQGYYKRQVERGWTGTVTPKKAGFHFDPLSQFYPYVDTNRTDQNFTAAPGSVTLRIEAKRLEEKKMMISMWYVKITVTLDDIDDNFDISVFMICRKEPGSAYIDLIPVEELQKNTSETFYDWDIKKNKSYIYKVEARDKNNKAVGASDETEKI